MKLAVLALPVLTTLPLLTTATPLDPLLTHLTAPYCCDGPATSSYPSGTPYWCMGGHGAVPNCRLPATAVLKMPARGTDDVNCDANGRWVWSDVGEEPNCWISKGPGSAEGENDACCDAWGRVRECGIVEGRNCKV